jgi:DNA-binding transcriptional regulator YiaG
MRANLAQIVSRSPIFRPSDIGLLLERLHTHAIKPRLSPEEFREVVASLGFSSPQEFGQRIGVEERTVESWSRFGMSRDAAQLLLALLNYRERLIRAMEDFEACTQVPIGSFFEDHRLP